MATTPTPPPKSSAPTAHAPPAHSSTAPPAPPEPAAPPPEPTAPDDDKPPVDKAQLEMLLRNGHRLIKKGDTADKWIALSRIGDQLCLAKPISEDEIRKLAEEGDYILA